MKQFQEVAPPGWGHTKAEKEKTDPSKPKSKIGGTAAAMKKAQARGDIPKKLNIFALMWSMKNKGDNPHYKPGTDKKYKKYQEEDWKPEIEVIDTKKRKKEAEKKRKEAADSLPPHLKLDTMKKAFSHTNESIGFTIDSGEHKKVSKKAKIRNLAKGNMNPNEKAAAEKKAGGPKLIGEEQQVTFEGWREKAADAIKKVAKKKDAPKHDYGKDAGAEAAKRIRKKDHETVNFLDPDD